MRVNSNVVTRHYSLDTRIYVTVLRKTDTTNSNIHIIHVIRINDIRDAIFRVILSEEDRSITQGWKRLPAAGYLWIDVLDHNNILIPYNTLDLVHSPSNCCNNSF